MDIAAMSVVMKQASLKQDASLAVMKNAMSLAEDNNNALMEMMQTPVGSKAPHPYLGNHIDIKG